MQKIQYTEDSTARTLRIKTSYRTALAQHHTRQGLARFSWATCLLALLTVGIWCFTAYQTAIASGAHNLQAILLNISTNAIDIHNNDALSQVLITYGGKYTPLIIQGQYWRLVTPIFLHANFLHIALNMLNLLVLGIFLERIAGHLRLLLIYLLTGIISMIASFYFVPQELSVGASGAIFGLVGAYTLFVLTHHRAFPYQGFFTMLWLLLVIGVNIAIGFAIPNVDNYAHLGGLFSGCLLGWLFMPKYNHDSSGILVDTHMLTRRWPLALLTILGTLLLAIIALYLHGTRS